MIIASNFTSRERSGMPADPFLVSLGPLNQTGEWLIDNENRDAILNGLFVI